MNVLFISRNSPFESIGGIERFIDNLISHYQNDTSEQSPHIFLMLSTAKESRIEKIGNVTIFHDNSLFLSNKNQSTKKEVSQKSENFAKNVTKIIYENHIDIISAENFHTDFPASYSLLLNIVSMSENIPVVLQLHSFATKDLETEIINQLKWDKVICVSKSVAGDCFQKGADINFLETHYLGVNAEEFNQGKKAENSFRKKINVPDNTRIILTASRIIRGKTNILQEKGIINLIESFSKISPRYPLLKLLIAIGKPPENLQDAFEIAFEMLEGYIKLHGVEENTILKTFSLHEMPEVYAGSDVFVLPSQNETFGQVFIEAMSSGLPVIGTKVGGIPEIISDSYNGFLMIPDDSSVLAQRIEKLINSEAVKNSFIHAGIKTVQERFSFEKQIVGFMKILEQILQR